jgi:DNA topoisomerase I
MPLDGDADTTLPAGPELAEAAGLHYVNDADPGITRVSTPKGVVYKDAKGRPVTDDRTLFRIKGLVIPPAWTDVWICPDRMGHIQATGRDQKGRKQYRYHPDWRSHLDQTKYERMAAFGRALPALRARVDADLARKGLPREKVLAAVVRLLEVTLIRVGNDEYARTNKSFGLTTLRDRHAKFEGSAAVRFEFKGKSGVTHSTGIRDRRLARIVKACQDIPGQRLFQYVDQDGARHAVTSADVNAYIADATGGPFTAKDFRTWAGTLAAAEALLVAERGDSDTALKRTVTAIVKDVAARLGNTPAVCRSSYIHPKVLESFSDGSLLDHWPPEQDVEQALLAFLEKLNAAGAAEALDAAPVKRVPRRTVSRA